MRYREGELPDPNNPYTESMHTMLTFSAGLALLIGGILLFLGLRGRKLWLISWSGGLILSSAMYIILRIKGIV